MMRLEELTQAGAVGVSWCFLAAFEACTLLRRPTLLCPFPCLAFGQLEAKREQHAQQLVHIEERLQQVVAKKDTAIASLRAELQVRDQRDKLLW